MKKLFFAALLVVSMGSSAFAGPKKITTFAKNNFQTEFKDATNVIWTAGENYSKVTFTLNNERMEAFYEINGDRIGASKAISLEHLPVGAKRSFAKKFSGYDVKEAIRFEGANGVAYFISAENETEEVIIKVEENTNLSIFKKTKK